MTRLIDWLLDWCFASLRDSAAYATGEGYAGDGYVYATNLGFKVHDHALAVSAQTPPPPNSFWATQPIEPEALRMMTELAETSAGPRTTYNAVRYFINNGKAPWWSE